MMESIRNFDDVIDDIVDGPSEMGARRGEYLLVNRSAVLMADVIPRNTGSTSLLKSIALISWLDGRWLRHHHEHVHLVSFCLGSLGIQGEQDVIRIVTS